MIGHRPNVREELALWWSVNGRDPRWPFTLFAFAHAQGWIPRQAYIGLLVLFAQLPLHIVAALYAEQSGKGLLLATALAYVSLATVIYAGVITWLRSRLGSLLILFLSLPILAMVIGYTIVLFRQ